jgi:hypothetical protein
MDTKRVEECDQKDDNSFMARGMVEAII